MDGSIHEVVRQRLERLLRALDAEDLEERVAPVKCAKHPESPACGEDYGVPLYGEPAPAPDEPPGG
jgi:hypothetical protein